MPGKKRQASDCSAVQSDPRLCCKHFGELDIFSCFYSLLLIETCTVNKKQASFFLLLFLRKR